MAQWTDAGKKQFVGLVNSAQSSQHDYVCMILKDMLHKILCGYGSSITRARMGQLVDGLLPGQTLNIDREIKDDPGGETIFDIHIHVKRKELPPVISEQEEFLQWLGYKE